MDRRSAGAELDGVVAVLFDDLRLFELQLLRAGHDDAVARGLDLLERGLDLVVELFRLRQLLQHLQKGFIVGDLHPGLPGQLLVKQRLRQMQLAADRAGAEVDLAHAEFVDRLELLQRPEDAFGLAEAGERARALEHGVVERGLDRMAVRQRTDPARQEEAQLLHREGVHDGLEQTADVLRLHVHAVHGEGLHAVFAAQLRAQGLRRGRAGALRIDENDEGLARLLHVGDGAGLGLAVVLARDIGDGPVCRDDDAKGAVVLHDLFGAELCRLRHGQLLRGPWRGDHAGPAVLGVADRAGDHVAHGVDQAHAQRRFAVGADARGLVRNEFRLRGHDGPAGAGLRQLVGGALALVDIFDVRQHELLHEALDECGFSRPHRADDADIDRAVRAPGDLLIDRSVFHSPPPLPYMGMRRSLPASTSGCVR